jgi:hypothetical protein
VIDAVEVILDLEARRDAIDVGPTLCQALGKARKVLRRVRPIGLAVGAEMEMLRS